MQKPRILLWMILVCLIGGTSHAQDIRLGWHGERMPDGLERGEHEKDYIWRQDGAVMVYVPAGEFTMGSADGDKDEEPAHKVWLDGFYIDKHEVTWGQWKSAGFDFSENPESRRPKPRAPDWGIVDTEPLLNVTWPEAKQYVLKVGKRLPTEAQWEKAARGTDQRTYPWGNEAPDFDRALWKEHPIAKKRVAPAISHPAGASPYGVLHMAGNVYEWCEDVYEKDYYRRSPERNPVNQGPGRYRVLRGGAFVLETSDLRSALRYRLLPEDRAPYIGFRAVLPHE